MKCGFKNVVTDVARNSKMKRNVTKKNNIENPPFNNSLCYMPHLSESLTAAHCPYKLVLSVVNVKFTVLIFTAFFSNFMDNPQEGSSGMHLHLTAVRIARPYKCYSFYTFYNYILPFMHAIS